MPDDLHHLMREALDQAQKAFDQGEVPVGALVVDNEGRIVAKAHNRPIALNDPTAHAEIQAIRRAAEVLGNYRLVGAALVVTIEPCIMCMGAALNARVERLVYGAPDPKAGAAGSLYDLSSDSRLNHRIEVVSGILKDECAALMQRFFKTRRKAAHRPCSGP
jgi:tRNA(adenine34) deaminase